MLGAGGKGREPSYILAQGCSTSGLQAKCGLRSHCIWPTGLPYVAHGLGYLATGEQWPPFALPNSQTPDPKTPWLELSYVPFWYGGPCPFPTLPAGSRLSHTPFPRPAAGSGLSHAPSPQWQGQG